MHRKSYVFFELPLRLRCLKHAMSVQAAVWPSAIQVQVLQSSSSLKVEPGMHLKSGLYILVVPAENKSKCNIWTITKCSNPDIVGIRYVGIGYNYPIQIVSLIVLLLQFENGFIKSKKKKQKRVLE